MQLTTGYLPLLLSPGPINKSWPSAAPWQPPELPSKHHKPPWGQPWSPAAATTAFLPGWESSAESPVLWTPCTRCHIQHTWWPTSISRLMPVTESGCVFTCLLECTDLCFCQFLSSSEYPKEPSIHLLNWLKTCILVLMVILTQTRAVFLGISISYTLEKSMAELLTKCKIDKGMANILDCSKVTNQSAKVTCYRILDSGLTYFGDYINF